MFITMGKSAGKKKKHGERNRFIPRILNRTSVTLKRGVNNRKKNRKKKKKKDYQSSTIAQG